MSALPWLASPASFYIAIKFIMSPGKEMSDFFMLKALIIKESIFSGILGCHI